MWLDGHTLAAHCNASVLAHALSFSCCSKLSPSRSAVEWDMAAAATGPVASVGVNSSYLPINIVIIVIPDYTA